MREPKLTFGPEFVKLVTEIDEFKGRWGALKTLSPDRLSELRGVATIASVGSFTRIEGAKLADAEVEDLLWRAIALNSFKTARALSRASERGVTPASAPPADRKSAHRGASPAVARR